MPSLSFGGTAPAVIKGEAAVTATLTIGTTQGQASGCTASTQEEQDVPWLPGGGAVLACVFLIGRPTGRRHRWRKLVGSVSLLALFVGGLSACGKGSQACNPTTGPGTTPGAYTIAVTGTSGSSSATATVNLNVQ
jgi:hypothetical protein